MINIWIFTATRHLFDFATAVQSKDSLCPEPMKGGRSRPRNIKTPVKGTSQHNQQQQQQITLHQQRDDLVIPKMSTDTQIERLREMTIKGQ